MQVWTKYQLGPGSIERVIRTNPVRKLPCWQSSNGQDSDMPIWILPRLLKCRLSVRKEREHDVGEAILSCLEMSWDGGLTPWLTSGWKMRCVNEGTRSLPVDFQIFHGMVCNALSILEKNVETLGCCAIQGACRSIQMGHFQESLKYHPSFFCHTCFFSILPCPPAPGSCVSCSRTWSRESTSVASGAPRVAGSRRPVVADGWRCLLGVARVGLVKTWGKVGVCDAPALPVLVWGRYGKKMFFVDF